MHQTSHFIWTKDLNHKIYTEPVIVYFRKKLIIDNQNIKKNLYISANCRYKLYVNGVFLQEGPQKGFAEYAFKDPVCLNQSVLRTGENVIACEVLYYPQDQNKRNDSLYYSSYPCLYVEDTDDGAPAGILEEDLQPASLSGAYGWKYRMAENIKITGEPFFPAPIHGMEIVSGDEETFGWQQPGYDDSTWDEAGIYGFFETNKPIAPFLLEKRTIPAMAHENGRMKHVICLRNSNSMSVMVDAQHREVVNTADSLRALHASESLNSSVTNGHPVDQVQHLLESGIPVRINPNTKIIVEISSGEETCAYPRLSIAGGKNAKFEILYSEGYVYPQAQDQTRDDGHPMPPIKGDRTDYMKGQLEGTKDHYTVGGYGTEGRPEVYVPYLFRTFRFIQLCIETKDEPLILLDYDYISTGYPLAVKYQPDIEDETMRNIWDISLRTLKRCMHETYVDCPFYEQLQYAMDSRAEILFTYELSGDDRLARQCMEAFRMSQRSDGMISACAPAVSVNVIPGFSIFYILMVHDHWQYFHDKALVKKHLNCIDNILNYFDQHLTDKGLVGSVGGILFQHRYWSFVDWCTQWNETIGVPKAALEGDHSITMESLLYLHGLMKAQELAEISGRSDLSKDYHRRAKSLAAAIKKYCIGKAGLIQDGPGVELYSTHAQVWAILDGLVNHDEGRKMLDLTFNQPDIPQCSVSMSFYLMLALDQIGDLEKLDKMWDPWRKMLGNHLTTCVENTTDERSDCHAWGAIILYAWPKIYGNTCRTIE